jgi:tetratricopeptide (TPR) repeat protein
LLAWILCVPSWAAGNEADPDQEAASRHFESGRAFYLANDYVHALEEFEATQRLRSKPELDYNIARCHDRLEHYREAVASYERYLAARPRTPDADEIRERVRTLKARLDAEAPASPSPPPSLVAPTARAAPTDGEPRRASRRTVIAVVVSVAVAVVAATAVGLGLGLRPSTDTSLGTVRSTQ